MSALLAIDGRSGAGKTSLAAHLTATLTAAGHDVALFHLEDLYPGWHGLRAGIDAYVREVLVPLASGTDARWRAWDWVHDAPGREISVTRAADVVLLEGVGAADPAARPFLSAALRLDAPQEQRRRLALARDGATYEPWWETWAAQEEALALAADGPLDLTLHVDEPGSPEVLAAAEAWALAALARGMGKTDV